MRQAIENANFALARLGKDNTANQYMIANALISMLDNNTPEVCMAS